MQVSGSWFKRSLRLQPHAQYQIPDQYQACLVPNYKSKHVQTGNDEITREPPALDGAKTTSHTANFSSHIYISMTRSFSALLQCFPCRNFATDGSRLHISCQSPLMEKVQSHSETCYCRPLCLRKVRYDWCRMIPQAFNYVLLSNGKGVAVRLCLLYLNLFCYIYPFLFPLQLLWAPVWSKFTVFLTDSQVWWMLAWTVGKKPKLLSDKRGMWILCV